MWVWLANSSAMNEEGKKLIVYWGYFASTNDWQKEIILFALYGISNARFHAAQTDISLIKYSFVTKFKHNKY